jgi:hypothetical protein
VLLVLLVACHDDTLDQHLPPLPSFTYVPAPVGWPLPAPIGHLGRTQAPQVAIELGVRGPVLAPLVDTTVLSVPGAPARAIVSGTIADGTNRKAIEMNDIDAGVNVWRDTPCNGPVHGVTDKTIVCGDKPVRGIAFDGRPLWTNDLPFESMDGNHVLLGTNGFVEAVDAVTGKTLAQMKLPDGAQRAYHSCGDDAREVFIYQDGTLRRALLGDQPTTTWEIDATYLGKLEAIDACHGDTLLLLDGGETPGVRAVARATGKTVSFIAGATGWWPARDGSDNVEVATASGITVWPRDLSTSIGMAPGSMPGLGPLIAQRGDRRLVEATDAYSVLLDKRGVVAFMPENPGSAALGDHAIMTSYSAAYHALRRLAVPERIARAPHLVAPSRGVALPAELRDVPELSPVGATIETKLFDQPQDRTIALTASAFDPSDASTLYVAGPNPAEDKQGALVAFDLRAKRERWRVVDTCGVTKYPAIAVTHDVIACGAGLDHETPFRAPSSAVYAYSHTGTPLWTWKARAAMLLGAGGDVVLVSDGLVAHVLDAATGRDVFQMSTSLAVAIADPMWGTIVISAERNRLVARTSRASFLPMWSLAVDGVVTRTQVTGDSVLVTLADGDAYRVRAADGAVTAMPAIGGEWQAFDDALVSSTKSAPAYRQVPQRTAPDATPAPGGETGTDSDEPQPPRLWQPIPVPTDDMDQRRTGQLVIYDPSGGVRARNDYLTPSEGVVVGGPRGAANSPFVIEVGEGRASYLVVDPATGNPIRRIETDVGRANLFSTIIDGTPITGAVSAYPLRITLF